MIEQQGARRESISPRIARALIGATLVALIGAPAAVAAPRVAAPTAPAAVTSTAVTYAYAPWLVDEAWYLTLVNCTRTGGWVLSSGACSGYGSGRYSAYVRPLVRSPGISDRVARPYAKLEAVRGLCSHFLDGNPGDRLRRAGFIGSAWAENIGCRDGSTNVRAAVLASHLFFQREKSTNGGHWRAIKNARYTYIGIGIWRYGSRIRLVTDFYRP